MFHLNPQSPTFSKSPNDKSLAVTVERSTVRITSIVFYVGTAFPMLFVTRTAEAANTSMLLNIIPIKFAVQAKI